MPISLTPESVAFLAQAPVAHLATADASGQPHVVPITFALLDGRLYSALDAKPKRVGWQRLKRVRNLLDNPRVAVVVDRYADDWSRLGYMLLSGAARLLTEGDEAARAIAALRAKYPQYRQGSTDLGQATLVVVEPEQVVTWGQLGP